MRLKNKLIEMEKIYFREFSVCTDFGLYIRYFDENQRYVFT